MIHSGGLVDGHKVGHLCGHLGGPLVVIYLGFSSPLTYL